VDISCFCHFYLVRCRPCDKPLWAWCGLC